MRGGLDLAAIRARHPLPDVVAASIKLQRAGREWKACCPFHPDRSPSFTIFDGGQRFHCFGCGADGDVLDFVRKLHCVDLREAAAMLDGGHLPVVFQPALPPRPDRDTTVDAQVIWRAAGPIAGTPAETYLRNRGIHYPLPFCLRFARLRYPGVADELPCLVALVISGDDKIGGIQRTFVREDGSGKADVKTAKLSLGRIAGGAIRLAPAGEGLIVTGGLEDGLTLHQDLQQPVWAVTGEGNMTSLTLPWGVRNIVIGADGDESGEAHAQRAAEAYAGQNRSVRIIRPMPGYKDFNAELQGPSS